MVNYKPLVVGMAWVTALGNSLEGVWNSLLCGETGIKTYSFSFKLKNNLAALVPDIPFALDSWARLQKLTLDCIKCAVNDSHIDLKGKKVQLVVGTSFGASLDYSENCQVTLYDWLIDVNKVLGYNTQPVLVSTSCSSGSDAIAMGAELIRSNSVDICICGGADILTQSKLMAHSELGTMSPTMLKAFDKTHDGTILGEGAAFIVLVNSQNKHLVKKQYGSIVGSASSNDASGFTAPDLTGQSVVMAIRRCLQDAHLDHTQVEIINAHGSGTVINDTVELKAYNALFQSQKKPIIFATKGNLGHTLGATGAMEVVALLLAIKMGKVPPVYLLDSPISDYLVPAQKNITKKATFQNGLSITLGFGGYNTCIAVQK
ncbi:MAG: beta-ketoacyl-[acyl-carrier-protein] synthase family protein [Ignavibacteriae bacterium]|nr:MAG: beta-ketoacyl-[acyl-carrier-protein] synthase family protein [Ignavibacteriota bacterium]